MIISLIFWSPHPPLIDTNNTILQFPFWMADDPWSQKISPYDVFMHCKTTMPSIKIDIFAVTSARSCLRSSERSTRRCTASRTRSTSTFTKCFSRSTSGPRCSRRSSRGPRGTAASSRYTHRHTHTPHHHLRKTTMSGSADSRVAHLRGTCQSTQSGDVTTKWMPRCLPERFRDHELVCCLSKCAIKLAPLDRHTTETLFLRRIIKPALYLCHISRPSFNPSATSLPEQISFEQNSKLLALI